MEVFFILLIFLMGVMSGCVVIIAVMACTAIGDLRIDKSDADGPFLFLELYKDQPVARLNQSSFVILRVNIEDYIPQE